MPSHTAIRLASILCILGTASCAEDQPRERAKREPAARGAVTTTMEEPDEPKPVDAPDGPEAAAIGCELNTGWAGDERCIEAPDPEKGFQLHFGPENYDDPEEVARYTLMPGEEKLLCSYVVMPNENKVYYDTWLNRLRPSSHHMIVTLVGAGDERKGVPCDVGGDGTENKGIIGGNTTTLMPLADTAPENVGVAKTLPPHGRAGMQLHFFNTGNKPLLMEAWQNIYYKDESEVVAESSPIESMAGLGMMVALGTTEVIKGALIAPEPLRVLDLYSHNHDHTLRFTIFLKRAGDSDRSLIYESYDWEHPLFLPYDSIHENPQADRDARVPGGKTGELMLQAGDALEFECEIRNDDVPTPLRFANQAHTAEMCIMRGDYATSFGKAWSSYSR